MTTTTTYDRIYALALAVAADAADGDILGTFDRTNEGLHDVVFDITLGLCDEDSALSPVEAPVVSGIVDDAIDDYLLNNPDPETH